MGRKLVVVALLLFAAAALVGAAGLHRPAFAAGWLANVGGSAGASLGAEGNVRWAGCQVAVLVPADAPQGFAEAVAAAADEVSAAAGGVVFSPRTVASTDALVAPDETAVVVVFADHSSGLYEHAGAAAETSPLKVADGVRYAERLLVDPVWFSSAAPSGAVSRTQLLVHELAHAAGAGHASSPESTMAPDLGSAVGVTPDTAKVMAALAPPACATR